MGIDGDGDDDDLGGSERVRVRMSGHYCVYIRSFVMI